MTVVVLVPHSESKALGGTHTQLTLTQPRQTVIEALSATMRLPSADKILSLKEPKLSYYKKANQDLLIQPLLPAYKRYTGVVLNSFNIHDVDNAAIKSSQIQIYFVSALLGLTTFAELIPDYKLKFSSSLPTLGNISKFWLPYNTSTLQKYSPSDTIINLLPQEHARTIDFSSLQAQVLHVNFRTAQGLAIGHHAKVIKGQLLKALFLSPDPIQTLHTFHTAHWSTSVEKDQINIVSL